MPGQAGPVMPGYRPGAGRPARGAGQPGPGRGMATAAPAAAAAPAARQAPGRAGLVLTSLIVVAAVANLNLSVANVALPSIGQAFDSSQTSLDLVAVGYSLGLAGSVLYLGAVGDRYGRKMMLLLGMALSVPACLLAAFAPSDTVLIVARICGGVCRRAWRSRPLWPWSRRCGPGRAGPGPSRCGPVSAQPSPRSARPSPARCSSTSTGARCSWSRCRWRWWRS